MCPACLTTAALAAGGFASASGLAALTLTRLRAGSGARARRDPRDAEGDEMNAHGIEEMDEMAIEVSAFRRVPPFAEGLVRDLRVRWALEEAGLAYVPRLIGPEDQDTERYRALQPFGQVPCYRENGLCLFESGAIVLHVAERSEALMPRDPAGRARAIVWMFAALSSVEPHVQSLAAIDLFHTDEPWAKERRPAVVEMVNRRLAVLSGWLDRRDYLEGRFTAGDLLMTTVLRILRHTDLVAGHPTLDAYVRRCEARPAFQKALADQMAAFAAHAPA